MGNNKIQKSIYDSEEFVKWGGLLNEFLWLCAGVDRKVLRQCPTDYAKYAGTGGTILFTALMAMLSGGYAMYTVFESTTTAIFFGIFWGLLIFNLDRFMVNTMYSDGTHKITKEEIKGGLPRIILAIFLGLVISTPIEMRIFNDKIEAQVIKDQIAETNSMKEANSMLADQIREIEDKIEANNSRIDKMRDELARIQDEAYDEATGHGKSGKAGIGNYTKQLEDRAKKLQNQIALEDSSINKSNSAYQKQLNQLYEQQSNAGNNIEISVKSMNGFTARFNALHEITSPRSGNWFLFIARIFIMLLFVSIEVIPTMFKMMVAAGPYDDLLRAEMHRVRVLSEKRISDVNDEVNTTVQISVEKNKERLNAELLANKIVLEKIATAQAELLDVAIESWRNEEMEKVKNNPSAYIKTNTTNNNKS